MAELKVEQAHNMLGILQHMKEFIITIPEGSEKRFRTVMSQTKHYMGIEERMSIKEVVTEDGITTLHVTLGTGKEIEYYDIKEVEDL